MTDYEAFSLYFVDPIILEQAENSAQSVTGSIDCKNLRVSCGLRVAYQNVIGPLCLNETWIHNTKLWLFYNSVLVHRKAHLFTSTILRKEHRERFFAMLDLIVLDSFSKTLSLLLLQIQLFIPGKLMTE